MKKKLKSGSRFKVEKKRKISEENAVVEVQKFCERYDLDTEPVEGEINKALESFLDSVTEYVSLGYLEFNHDKFEITQHLQDPPGDVKELVYGQIGGAQKRAMDGYGSDEHYGKVYALMGSACGLEEAIEKLKGVDLKVVEALGLAFLA